MFVMWSGGVYESKMGIIRSDWVEKFRVGWEKCFY